MVGGEGEGCGCPAQCSTTYGATLAMCVDVCRRHLSTRGDVCLRDALSPEEHAVDVATHL